ncbi:hypothetical protein AN641_03155 [Candidatus Epulonipiscioides gigas]|nr:hypothetical protein AN641_03155 [Epulopiscium sp. SCG-C07WGA-EpuloA2]
MFKVNKILNKLNNMLDRAISSEDIETTFDESKLSKIENKFYNYLKSKQIKEQKIFDDKQQLDALISDISHQTKTPLSNISLYSGLMLECSSNQELEQYTNLLIKQSERLEFLVNFLVKMSRIENGIIQPKPIAQSVNLLLQHLKQSFSDINVDDSSDVILYYDLKWTSEAIVNIIDNAIKYGGKQISITCVPYTMFCKIDITDDGIGIAESEIPKIFQRFYRSEHTNNIEGLGIGLYISREIIAQQNGYIKVTSKLGIGSTFSVFLKIR